MPPALPAGLDALLAPLARGLADGRLLDAVIGLLLAEALALAWWSRRPGGPPVATWLPMVAAGLGLLAGWRSMVADAPVHWTLTCLAAAGLAQAWDLWRRCRGR